MNPLRTVRRVPLLAYFVLAFALSWALVLLVVWPAGFPARGTQYAQLGALAFLAMLPGPSLAGIGLTALLDERAGLRGFLARLGHWRVGLRWYATLLITPAVLVALALLAPIWPVF